MFRVTCIALFFSGATAQAGIGWGNPPSLSPRPAPAEAEETDETDETDETEASVLCRLATVFAPALPTLPTLVCEQG